MQDILDDTDGDLLLVYNDNAFDISFGESTEQHQKDLLLARRGDYRISPNVGVGLKDFLNDENPDELYRAIRTQFAQDGMKLNSIQIVNTKINIDAYYPNGQ